MFQSRARSVVALMLLAAGVAGSSTAAADASPATHACAALEDPVERLACFDAAFAPLGAAEPGPEVVEEFGLSESQLQARDPERRRDKGPKQIEAQVASIRRRSTGERVITLDKGQVWLQTEVTVRGPLSPGDTVLIRRAAFGSFQIVTPGRVALRVRRIE